MLPQVIESFIPIVFFASVLLAVYFFLRFRNSERLALIEKAADPAMFKTTPFRFPWFKIGILATGVGIGVLVGGLLQHLHLMFNGAEIPFSMLIFGGLAMVLAAKLDKPKTEENK